MEKWSTPGLEKQIYLMSLKYLVAENKDTISKLTGTYGNHATAGFKKTMTIMDHNSLSKQRIHESIIKSLCGGGTQASGDFEAPQVIPVFRQA